MKYVVLVAGVVFDVVGIVYSAVHFFHQHDDTSGERLIFTVFMLPLFIAIWFTADRSTRSRAD